MDLQSDFDTPPYAGQFETEVDCGLFGILPARIVWEIDHNDHIRIDQIEIRIWPALNMREEKWVDLAMVYENASDVLARIMKDADLIYESELDFERAMAQYRAEGGAKVLRCI